MVMQSNTTSSRSGGSTEDTLSTIFTDFDKNMDTYIKKTPRLPTGAEFLSDFENAFNTRLAEIMGGNFGGQGIAGLGPNEAEFARNVLFPALFSQYQAKLGQIAKTGQSPFVTAAGGKSYQTSRSSGGQSSNSRGNTRSSTSETRTTTGPDGSVTDTVTGGGEQNTNRTETESINVTENQTIEEDILLPKVMPLDFLNEVLTPSNVKVAYEGNRRGSGQFQSSGTGVTSARRV